MSHKAGSIPTGPSEQYLRLLKGEISPQEYAQSVKERVDETRRGDRRNGERSAVQRKRA